MGKGFQPEGSVAQRGRGPGNMPLKPSAASVGLLGRAVVGERPEAWRGTRQVDPGHGGLQGPDEGPCSLGSSSRLKWGQGMVPDGLCSRKVGLCPHCPLHAVAPTVSAEFCLTPLGNATHPEGLTQILAL